MRIKLLLPLLFIFCVLWIALSNTFSFAYEKNTNYHSLSTLFDQPLNTALINRIKPKKPTINRSSGTYEQEIELMLHSEEQASIFFTTDGTVPSSESQLYNQPIILSKGTHTLKAIAINDGFKSDILESTYWIAPEDPNLHFKNKKIESSVVSYVGKDMSQMTSKDVEQVKSILILGKEFYIDFNSTEPHYSKSTELDDYTLEYVTVDRNNRQTQYTYVPFTNLPSMEDIQLFLGVEKLHIYSQDTFDIAYLTPLKQLKEIQLHNIAHISNLALFSQMQNIEQLSIVNSNLSDLQFVLPMDQLTDLNFSYNKIIDDSVLLQLPLLKKINISYNPILDSSSDHLQTSFNLSSKNEGNKNTKK